MRRKLTTEEMKTKIPVLEPRLRHEAQLEALERHLKDGRDYVVAKVGAYFDGLTPYDVVERGEAGAVIIERLGGKS